MADENLLSQATEIASALTGLIRRFFTIDSDDDPATELPVAQMRVCGILRDGPHTMSALSHDLGISQSAITQIADRLERAGLVERVPEAEDRRMKSLRLTRYGEAVSRRRLEGRIKRISEALARLSPEERERVLAGLNTLLGDRRTGGPVDSIPARLE